MKVNAGYVKKIGMRHPPSAEKAFQWIVDLLDQHKVPFQVTGGLAAQVYGSDRPLADIDLDVAEEDILKIAPYVKNFTTLGPEQIKDEHWDLLLLRLNYQGQEIDLGGAYQAKIFDPRIQQWTLVCSDFKTAQTQIIFERKVKVVAKEFLIAYKAKLGREVDLMDIQNIA